MNILEMKEKMQYLNTNLTHNQKKYINYRSFENFIFHFEKLNDSRKIKVKGLLNEYFEAIDQMNFNFDGKTGLELAIKYLYPLEEIYASDLGFKEDMSIRRVIVFGVLADSILFIIGMLKFVYYIPIVTLILFGRRLFLIKAKREKKVYGIFY